MNAGMGSSAFQNILSFSLSITSTSKVAKIDAYRFLSLMFKMSSMVEGILNPWMK
jgi:hypothetical protein